MISKFKITRYVHRPYLLYETTLARHVASIGVVIILVVTIVVMGEHFANPKNAFDIRRISVGDVFRATGNTCFRMLQSYMLSIFTAIPPALLIARSTRNQRILLPIADVLQSIPVLAFFPVVVVFFTAYGAFELAAVFVIFASTLWNIVFTVVGGLQTIPEDIKSAAIVFKVKDLKEFWFITLPGIVPFIVTGSMLAWDKAGLW
jgi:ABC-type anion transport system duplicated permease subunit